ncbi:aminotransferase class V-fold PLP-dependent enzyme [Candidatus Bipolaricaulota bacterium]|nr:aminotransferase class V-fold PLP-dependent enzyme [Candidatus Bipolaricaulota bacterium]
MSAQEDLRDLFLLRRDVAFLNHGSFGACPQPVFKAYQRWQRELEAEPVEFLDRRFEALMAEARSALGAFLSADPDDLVFVPNATTAMNVVAQSLPLAPGDEVLSTNHEYGAVDRMWRLVCAERGARYVRAEIGVPVRSEADVVEAVWARRTPRTRVLSISHITSPTALLFPVAELVRRAREEGILTVVDGAHAPGQVPLALEALGADFYAGNCHKWLLAPKGAGFLHARRERQPLLRPLVVSWGGEGSKGPGPSPFLDDHQWQGTRDIAPFLAVPAAIQFMEDHDWNAVRARCRALLTAFSERAEAELGLRPVGEETKPWPLQMRAFALTPCDGRALQRRLFDRWRIEVPVIAWNGRSLLRVSVQGYNTRRDLDALVRALQEGLRTWRGWWR